MHCHKDPDQLFNLKTDPKELQNLAENEEHQERLAAFQREALERWDNDVLTEAVLISQRRRRLVVSALNKGKKKSWDHQPFFDSSEMYMRNHIDLDDLETRSRFPKVD
ncbi:hypothetical protein O1D97_00085 [Marinomonas sp. 15G1-11]|uniref:Choline sulfatase enzyme C-terminal domain-containing protein n=1 Tax=Marinomonas phaeophyticola TaxID=3004091 RepID=A0ABT4JNY1_9GAMM|nr:hypothetical protein [Marinomonas sp. 15G1-11]MCZ2720080.1 hypothetical protein [Marinomonas sp. 15G1-11]